MEHPLDGWDIARGADAEWMPWGGEGAPARAKIVGTGDGYVQVLVEAQAGCTGTPHEHEHTEFSYLLSGKVEHQGVAMEPGDGYVAAAGSTHSGFTVTSDATYLVVFKL